MKKQFLLLLLVATSFVAILTVGQTALAQNEKHLKLTPVSDTSKPAKKTDTVPPKRDTTKDNSLFN